MEIARRQEINISSRQGLRDICRLQLCLAQEVSQGTRAAIWHQADQVWRVCKNLVLGCVTRTMTPQDHPIPPPYQGNLQVQQRLIFHDLDFLRWLSFHCYVFPHLCFPVFTSFKDDSAITIQLVVFAESYPIPIVDPRQIFLNDACPVGLES